MPELSASSVLITTADGGPPKFKISTLDDMAHGKEPPVAQAVVEPVAAPVAEPSVPKVVDNGAPLFKDMDTQRSWEMSKPLSPGNDNTATQDTGRGRLGRLASKFSNVLGRNRGGSDVGPVVQNEPASQARADAVVVPEVASSNTASAVDAAPQVQEAPRRSARDVLAQLQEEHAAIGADKSDLVQAGVMSEPTIASGAPIVARNHVDESQLQFLRDHGVEEPTVGAALQRNKEVAAVEAEAARISGNSEAAQAQQPADAGSQEATTASSGEPTLQETFTQVKDTLGSEFRITMTPEELTAALDTKLGNKAENEEDARKEAGEVLQLARQQEGQKLYDFLVDNGFSVAAATPESLVGCLRETWSEDDGSQVPMFPEYAGLDDATLQTLAASSVEYAKQHAGDVEPLNAEEAERMAQARGEQAAQLEQSADEKIGVFRKGYAKVAETIKKHDLVASAAGGFLVRGALHVAGIDVHSYDAMMKGVAGIAMGGTGMWYAHLEKKHPQLEEKQKKQLDRVQKWSARIAAFAMGYGAGAAVEMAVDAGMGGLNDGMQLGSPASTESSMAAGSSIGEQPAATETLSPPPQPSPVIEHPQASAAGLPKSILAEPVAPASTAAPVSSVGETVTPQAGEHVRFPASQWPPAEHSGNGQTGMPAIGSEAADTAPSAVATGGSVTPAGETTTVDAMPSSTPVPEQTVTASTASHATIESESPLSHVLNVSDGSSGQPALAETGGSVTPPAMEVSPATIADTAAVQPVETPSGATNQVSAEVAVSTPGEQVPQPEIPASPSVSSSPESASVVPGQEQFENTVTMPEAKAFEAIPETKALNGAIVKGTVGEDLSYNGNYWHILETGVDTIQSLPLDEAQKNSLDNDALKRALQEATTLWSKGELNAETHSDIWKIFHLANRTTSVFNQVRSDPETIQALVRLGIVK